MIAVVHDADRCGFVCW